MSWFGDLIGSFDGQNAKNAAKQVQQAAISANNSVTAATQPYIDQESTYLNSNLLPQITAENPYLEAEHRQNVAQIGQTTQAQQRSAVDYWGANGNTGRGRGEAQRIGQAGLSATLGENTSYGLNTTDIQKKAALQYYNGLMGLGNEVGNIAQNNANRLYGANVDAAGLNLQGADAMGTTVANLIGMWKYGNLVKQAGQIGATVGGGGMQ